MKRNLARFPEAGKARQDDEKTVILGQIRRTKNKLEAAHRKFDVTEDDDLIEAVIFEIRSLTAQYRYLLKITKERRYDLVSA